MRMMKSFWIIPLFLLVVHGNVSPSFSESTISARRKGYLEPLKHWASCRRPTFLKLSRGGGGGEAWWRSFLVLHRPRRSYGRWIQEQTTALESQLRLARDELAHLRKQHHQLQETSLALTARTVTPSHKREQERRQKEEIRSLQQQVKKLEAEIEKLQTLKKKLEQLLAFEQENIKVLEEKLAAAGDEKDVLKAYYENELAKLEKEFQQKAEKQLEELTKLMEQRVADAVDKARIKAEQQVKDAVQEAERRVQQSFDATLEAERKRSEEAIEKEKEKMRKLVKALAEREKKGATTTEDDATVEQGQRVAAQRISGSAPSIKTGKKTETVRTPIK